MTYTIPKLLNQADISVDLCRFCRYETNYKCRESSKLNFNARKKSNIKNKTHFNTGKEPSINLKHFIDNYKS